MAIDKTRPPGQGPPVHNAADDPVAPTEDRRTFALKIDSNRASQGTRTADRGVVEQLDKAVLKDPVRLKTAVRALASEMVAGQTQQLSREDRECLLEFLVEDPIISGQFEAHLRRVLR